MDWTAAVAGGVTGLVAALGEGFGLLHRLSGMDGRIKNMENDVGKINNGKFQPREMCSLMHTNIDKRLQKIEEAQEEMRKCQEKMHVTLVLLFTKVDEIGKKIVPGYVTQPQLTQGMES